MGSDHSVKRGDRPIDEVEIECCCIRVLRIGCVGERGNCGVCRMVDVAKSERSVEE